MKKIGNTIRMFLWLTLLTGVIYPLLITAIAQLTLKQQADGNFLVFKEKIVGAVLIAQKFEDEKYFWARPSTINYNPLPSGGSNLGPTSAALKNAVEERRAKILQSHKVDKDKVPVELLFSSGSGLDPHISLPAAYFQVDRVAKARNLRSEEIKQLIDHQIIEKPLGFLGQEYVNVLMLNRALDEFFNRNKD